MPSPLSNTTKIYQVIFGGALVGLGFMVTKSIMRSGETSFKWNPGLLAALPVFTWIFMVFLQKSPGIAKLGSTYVGTYLNRL